MKVRKRGKSFVVDFSVNGKRHRETYKTKLQADTRLKDLSNVIEGGGVPSPMLTPKTLKQMGNKTYDRFWKGTRNEKKAWENFMMCVDIIGDVPMQSITYFTVDNLIQELRERGNKNSTINRKLSSLSKVLTYAEQLGVTVNRPHVPFLREDNNRTATLSKEEEETMIEVMVANGYQRVADFLIVAIDTGARFSELRNVDKSDIKNGSLTFTKTKNDMPRTVPLTDRAMSILTHKLDVLLVPEQELYKAWRMFRYVMDRELDEDFTPYITRHTCASRLVQNGLDLYRVKTWMGHKSITTTMRYAHLDTSAIEEGKNILNKLNRGE